MSLARNRSRRARASFGAAIGVLLLFAADCGGRGKRPAEPPLLTGRGGELSWNL